MEFASHVPGIGRQADIQINALRVKQAQFQASKERPVRGACKRDHPKPAHGSPAGPDGLGASGIARRMLAGKLVTLPRARGSPGAMRHESQRFRTTSSSPVETVTSPSSTIYSF